MAKSELRELGFGDILQEAVTKGYFPIAEILMNMPGMDQVLPCNELELWLRKEAEMGHVSTLKSILDRLSSSLSLRSVLSDLLYLASRKGHQAVLEFLLPQLDHEGNARCEELTTLLGIAGYQGHISIVEWLMHIPGINVNY